ncbi:hypothetical protein DFH05DRAFT_1095749 [Lentinula detonsa]|uniref:Uncharacterized protein n=1 Tax=Lentinula detonsa TaxID=2804962 RepID=A0A9W8TY81_9AGAR|nr:hypothetical protein DFH05DRAFT_1095749 [Lentinula detonsa]
MFQSVLGTLFSCSFQRRCIGYRRLLRRISCLLLLSPSHGRPVPFRRLFMTHPTKRALYQLGNGSWFREWKGSRGTICIIGVVVEDIDRGIYRRSRFKEARVCGGCQTIGNTSWDFVV